MVEEEVLEEDVLISIFNLQQQTKPKETSKFIKN